MRQFLFAGLIALAGCSAPQNEDHSVAAVAQTEKAKPCGKGQERPCVDLLTAHRIKLKRQHDQQMARGYKALLRKVGMSATRLEADYGTVDDGLIALGCKDQLPGKILAVFRTGDVERDYWCVQKAKERAEAPDADANYQGPVR